ncbi:hypothetical protein CKF54_00920 [Psittacicella hinzii]|uniref:Uncharacterized protein n=1 Tax=Psittacicella hinzii TaxID=2028575 RepID=A0A3A1Y9H5_9GAMM|nr:hypothetical protein [Psittacicella hinzii]RIY34335.1 hypothetical protein CKF54_00920 [Psittacicella hinzii]
MSSKKTQKEQLNLPAKLHCKHVADDLNIDFRTLRKNLERIGVPIERNYFSTKDFFKWFLEYCQTLDKRRAINKAGDSSDDIYSEKLVKPFGKLHLKNPAKYDQIFKGLYSQIRVLLATEVLVHEDDVRRLIFVMFSKLSSILTGYSKELTDQGVEPKLLDLLDPLIHRLQTKIYKDLAETIEEITMVEGEEISLTQVIEGLGVDIHAIAPYPVDYVPQKKKNEDYITDEDDDFLDDGEE